MANKTDAAPQLAPAPDTDPTMTLDEFCARLSETVKRPELIGGFHFVERAAGRQRDTAASFQSRLGEFMNKPV